MTILEYCRISLENIQSEYRTCVNSSFGSVDSKSEYYAAIALKQKMGNLLNKISETITTLNYDKNSCKSFSTSISSIPNMLVDATSHISTATFSMQKVFRVDGVDVSEHSKIATQRISDSYKEIDGLKAEIENVIDEIDHAITDLKKVRDEINYSMNRVNANIQAYLRNRDKD